MDKVLKVGVGMGGGTSEESVPLPDNWDEMSDEEQRAWADDALEAHVANKVDSWHYVADA